MHMIIQFALSKLEVIEEFYKVFKLLNANCIIMCKFYITNLYYNVLYILDQPPLPVSGLIG
jgi:hypothetical protein